MAKVNGAPLLRFLQATFASQNPTVVDLASGAPGDSTGTGLFYLVMVCNLVGYIGVMMFVAGHGHSRQTQAVDLGCGLERRRPLWSS
ncbi:hypothetical protein ACFPQC_01265, partial [Kibdelosporangium philippinense]